MKLSALERAIHLVGSQSELARRCGVKQQHIWNWLNRTHRIPAEQVLNVERATDGQISRHDLRPDLYPSNARETAA